MAARPPLPTGGPYGSRQDLEQFQASGPMLPEPSPALPRGPAGGAVTPPATPPNVFGPTERPDEPITAGIPYGPGPNSTGVLPRDDNMRLRAAYRAAVVNGWDGADDIAEMIAQGGN